MARKFGEILLRSQLNEPILRPIFPSPMKGRREDYVYAFEKKLTNIKRKKDIPKELTTNEETTHESQNAQTCHGISLRLSANEPIESPINSQLLAKKPIESKL